MATDHNIRQLIINKVPTKAQYDQMVKNADELYLTPDDSNGLPDQTGQSGKFLKTNGTNASWDNVPAGTVTSVRVQAGTGLSSSQSTAQNTTLNTTISIASGYKLPTTTEWSGKQDALTTQTAYTSKGTATKVPQITTNTLGQVTNITEVTITQPTVNNSTITIQKNSTTVDSFTLNQSSGKTINISVPTKVSDLNNDSGFITGITANNVTTALGYTPYNSTNPNGYISGINANNVTTALGYTPYNSTNPNGYITSADIPTIKNLNTNNTTGQTASASESLTGTGTVNLHKVSKTGSYNDLLNKPTIPTVNNATLTIQKNGTTVSSFSANASSNVTCNITIPTKLSEFTDDLGSSPTHIHSQYLTSHQNIKVLKTDNTAAQSTSAGEAIAGNGTISLHKIAKTGTFGDLLSKPTSISGYGITDAYTKTEVDGMISSVYKPAGSVAFASLPTLASGVLGNVYNVTDAFTTTNDFVEGSGKNYPAGTNVVVVNTGTSSSPTYKFDVLSGFVDLSGYVPTSRKVNNKSLSADITLTASDVGALPDNTTIPQGTVTSVRVQAGTGLVSSVSTAQTTSLNTTISIASGYKLPTTTEWGNKQDKLTTQTAYTSKGSATKVPQITTNTLGQVTGITEVDITQPTVNDSVVAIQKNNTTVSTFTLNQSTSTTVNITVPTKTSDITNDSGFLTSHQSIKTLKTDNTTTQTASSSEAIAGSGTINLHKVSKTGSYNDLLNKPTIPTVNNSTITIQKNGTNVDSFTTNAASNKSINITVPTTAADVGAVSTTDGVTGVVAGSTADKINVTKNGSTSTITVNNVANADKAKLLIEVDTRSVNSTPQEYMQDGKGISTEFKTLSSIGITGNGTYGQLQTYRTWGDSSGGYPTQICVCSSNNKIFRRVGTSNTVWGEWKEIAFTDAIPTKTSDLTNDSGFLTEEVDTLGTVLNRGNSATTDINMNSKDWFNAGVKLTSYYYSTSQTPNTQYYWYKLEPPTSGSKADRYFISIDSDVNYPQNRATFLLDISKYSSNSYNVSLNCLAMTGGKNTHVLNVAIDADGYVYVQSDAVWSSYMRFVRYGTESSTISYTQVGLAAFGTAAGFTPVKMITDTGCIRLLNGAESGTYYTVLPSHYFRGDLVGNADTATSATKATKDGDNNTISSTYLKLAGGTLTGAVNTANNTLNKIGDDAYIGDVNIGGCIGIKGQNGASGIVFKPYSGSTDIKMTSNGSGTLTVTGTISSTFSGDLTGNVTGTASKATADADGNTISTTYLKSHQSIKSLKTDNTTAQTTSSSEAIAGSGTINLHKVSKTGSYSDLLNKPTIPATNVIPATTTANKVLVSTTTSGTAKWSDFNTAGLLKTNTSGVVSVDTTSYGTYSKPSGGIPASDLAESYYLASNPNGYTSNAGTVTSVRVQATSPIQSSTNTAQSSTLNTTISLADGYGDTKNPYASKTKNYVLAAPSTANGVPTFRALTKADIPLASETAASSGTTTSLVTTGEKYTWNNKQNALTAQTAYSAKGSATKVPQITTNTLGQVTGITEVDITHPTELPSQTGQSGKFLTTNGSTVSWAAASTSIDNSTITKNGSDQLQTVGYKDVRTNNTLKTWTGTRAQYDAIVTKDPNTLYNITDDTDTTAAMLELLYPVGAVYIGTMDVCPLATLGIGSWEKIAEDQVLQGSSLNHNAGTTIAAGLPNIKGQITGTDSTWAGAVICSPTSTGAFTLETLKTSVVNTSNANSYTKNCEINFSASDSNSIYSDDINTVQPPAFVVNIWRRIS